MLLLNCILQITGLFHTLIFTAVCPCCFGFYPFHFCMWSLQYYIIVSPLAYFSGAKHMQKRDWHNMDTSNKSEIVTQMIIWYNKNGFPTSFFPPSQILLWGTHLIGNFMVLFWKNILDITNHLKIYDHGQTAGRPWKISDQSIVIPVLPATKVHNVILTVLNYNNDTTNSAVSAEPISQLK